MYEYLLVCNQLTGSIEKNSLLCDGKQRWEFCRFFGLCTFGGGGGGQPALITRDCMQP